MYREDGSFVLGQRFSSDVVTYTMPGGTTVCDIQTLTVWCAPVDVIFAQVSVNRAEVLVSMQQGCKDEYTIRTYVCLLE